LRLFFISLALVLAGCATIATSPTQSLTVQTFTEDGREIEGAICVLTNSQGRFSVVTPGIATVKKAFDKLNILCSKEGFASTRFTLESTVNLGVAGNILLPGIIIGAIVDHTSGAAYKYPEEIVIRMSIKAAKKFEN
jgi:hypothetical protein